MLSQRHSAAGTAPRVCCRGRLTFRRRTSMANDVRGTGEQQVERVREEQIETEGTRPPRRNHRPHRRPGTHRCPSLLMLQPLLAKSDLAGGRRPASRWTTDRSSVRRVDDCSQLVLPGVGSGTGQGGMERAGGDLQVAELSVAHLTVSGSSSIARTAMTSCASSSDKPIQRTYPAWTISAIAPNRLVGDPVPLAVRLSGRPHALRAGRRALHRWRRLGIGRRRDRGRLDGSDRIRRQRVGLGERRGERHQNLR